MKSILLSFSLPLYPVLLLITGILVPIAAHAGGTVNTCTESALVSALSGGGTVTFACDGTIYLTSPKTISANTVLTGDGHNVTLSGSNSVQLFVVNGGISFTVYNLTLANGKASGNGGGISKTG